MDSRSLCMYLEESRRKKNFTMEKFVEDIVSIRQYKRYLYGESQIPISTAIELSNRLNIKALNLFHEINTRTQKETSLLNEFHSSIIRNPNEANKLKEKLSRMDFISSRNEVYFNICKTQLDFRQKAIHKHHMIQSLSSIIGYPRMLENELYDSIDLLGLITLIRYLQPEDQLVVVNKVYDSVKSQNSTIFGFNIYLRPYVYANLARFYGIHNEFNKVIELCLEGISIQKKNKSNYVMEHFYYYLSLVFFKENDTEKFHNSLFKCYSYLVLDDNISRLKSFDTLMKKDFNCDTGKLYLDYVDNVISNLN